jgi:hypothetical protein
VLLAGVWSVSIPPIDPDDGEMLVAGVLYDTETLDEVPAQVETPIGGIVDDGADAA